MRDFKKFIKNLVKFFFIKFGGILDKNNKFWWYIIEAIKTDYLGSTRMNFRFNQIEQKTLFKHRHITHYLEKISLYPYVYTFTPTKYIFFPILPFLLSFGVHPYKMVPVYKFFLELILDNLQTGNDLKKFSGKIQKF
jgi:hypothetical protein